MNDYQNLSALERLGLSHKKLTKLNRKNIFNDKTIAFNPELFDPASINELLKDLTEKAADIFASNESLFMIISKYFRRQPLTGAIEITLGEYPRYNENINKIYYQSKKAEDYIKKILSVMQSSITFLNEVDLSVLKKVYDKFDIMYDKMIDYLGAINYDVETHTSTVNGNKRQDIEENTVNVESTIDKIYDMLNLIITLSPKGIYGKGLKKSQY